MASIKQFDRCCNPFKLESHLRKMGLRPATDIMKVTLGLDGNYLLCSSCRKEASKLVKEQTNASDDPNVDASDHEDDSSDNNENNDGADSDSNTTATDLPLSLSFRSLSFNSEPKNSQSSSASQVSAALNYPL
ncbi:uncharacterized protein LOC123270859 [Cotesia glomerata]|uniref:uncharacterized protein LOC123270859 n=1 Tax=Cotesia glomerata TaxID=32391 RepID=UPI001D00CE93|nr:uncharacterized protein LOC123270859 [Cotesia glomerata]